MKKYLLGATVCLVLALGITACSGNGNNDAKSTSSNSPSPTDTTSQTTDDLITEDQAREIALAHAGIAAEDATFINLQLDYDDGRKIYEVEFYSGDTEYNYEIDAQTGEIISFDYDIEDYVLQSDGQASTNGDLIGDDRAKEIALEKVEGASGSDIHLYLEYDDGTAVYDGTIVYDQVKYEFEIDAATGEIRSWESESVHD